MAHEPGYYKQLLESLLETDATPTWVRSIIATEHGPVAVFNNLNHPIFLEDDEIIHARRVELDAANGIIRVYISRRDAELVVHDQNPKEYDAEFTTFFEKLFAPYELVDVHRSRHHDFIRYNAHEAYMTYGSYYLGGQVESAWFDYLHGMDYETQLSAVKSDPSYIRYVDDPDDTMQMAAVNGDPYTIQYIENPTDAVQLAAIKAIPAVLTYIENPTILLQSNIKHYILKYLLERLKINAVYHVTEMVNYLRKHGVQWPDLAVIERSMGPNKIGN
jgi:hypothetical protein